MRKAGELIAQFLRESKLATSRSEPIGAGAYGVVYESDVPGNVMKQTYEADGTVYGKSLEDEANLQAIAAEMGIAPRVAGLETFPGGIGNRIEMQDIRNNFENAFEAGGADVNKLRTTDIRTAQQLGQLALKGVRLEDRNPANVYQNKMTGRPMQLDFGIADRVEGSEQAAWLTHVTAEGFESAGLIEEAAIYRATVMDLLEGGDVTDAMDVAKQGFSRLQKIKEPVKGLVPSAKTALAEQALQEFDL